MMQSGPDRVLDLFKRMVAAPKRTIAWGHSLGGMVTAALIQTHPDRFDAALPMCGVFRVEWQRGTRARLGVAFKTLLAPGTGLEIVNISNPFGNLQLAEQFLAIAQSTPRGEQAGVGIALLTDRGSSHLPEPSPLISPVRK